jgi:hypothetical protein
MEGLAMTDFERKAYTAGYQAGLAEMRGDAFQPPPFCTISEAMLYIKGKIEALARSVSR